MDFVGRWTPFWLKDGFYVYIRCVAFVITMHYYCPPLKKGEFSRRFQFEKKNVHLEKKCSYAI